MSNTSLSMEQLSQMLESTSLPSTLQEILIQAEGEVSLHFGDSHLASDTEFLSTFYSAYLIALLLNDEINEAHMLIGRMPPSLVRVDPVLKNCLTLLRAVWNNNHSQVYATIRQPLWPDALKGLVHSYETHFQNKTMANLSLAYGAIRPSTAASYLGFDLVGREPVKGSTGDASPELIIALTTRGWVWDQETKMFYPKPGTGISICREGLGLDNERQ